MLGRPRSVERSRRRRRAQDVVPRVPATLAVCEGSGRDAGRRGVVVGRIHPQGRPGPQVRVTAVGVARRPWRIFDAVQDCLTAMGRHRPAHTVPCTSRAGGRAHGRSEPGSTPHSPANQPRDPLASNTSRAGSRGTMALIGPTTRVTRVTGVAACHRRIRPRLRHPSPMDDGYPSLKTGRISVHVRDGR
jgi:hypothetical protein